MRMLVRVILIQRGAPMSIVNFCDLKKNHLLGQLLDIGGQQWSSKLEQVEMCHGQVLYDSGCPLRYTYFPTTAVVSLLSLLENGASVKIAIVGNDGIVGVPLFVGAESTLSRAVVHGAGHGYRISAAILKEESEHICPVLNLLLRYTQTLITQITQTAVCNRHHVLERQLCHCLLQCLDRAPSNELIMTQALIASMLGVRREGVTEAAIKLQAAGLIRYSRGHITVLDREGLEKNSCECYAILKRETNRLLLNQVAISH